MSGYNVDRLTNTVVLQDLSCRVPAGNTGMLRTVRSVDSTGKRSGGREGA